MDNKIVRKAAIESVQNYDGKKRVPVSFLRTAAQGDVYLKRVESFAHEGEEMEAENGQIILGHSETGHHHVIQEAIGVRACLHNGNDAFRYLEVGDDVFTEYDGVRYHGVVLQHLRGVDTHGPIHVKPGKYVVKRQRESRDSASMDIYGMVAD